MSAVLAGRLDRPLSTSVNASEGSLLAHHGQPPFAASGSRRFVLAYIRTCAPWDITPGPTEALAG